MTRARLTAAAAGLAALLLTGRASASPEDIFGYGPRGPAMGGVGTTTASGFEAVYANPALLAAIRRNKLTLGFLGAAYALDARGAGLPGRVGAERARGATVGIDIPIPLGGQLKDRVGAGFAFYTPTDIIVRGRLLYPEKPQFPLLPDRTQSLTLRGGIGVDPGHGVKVGVGFAALAEIVGSVVVATDASGRVGTRVENQLVATYAPALGATWDLPVKEPIRVGVSYRGRLDARFAVSIDGRRLSSLQIPVFNIAGLAQFDPEQLSIEASWHRSPSVLALGVTIKRWSQYPGPIEPTLPCPADEPECGSLVPAKVDYANTLVVHVGGERRVPLGKTTTLALRLGARYEPSPLPDNLPGSEAFSASKKGRVVVPTRYFDADRAIASAGFGVAFRGAFPCDVDAFGQYHHLVPRSVRSDGDTPSDGEVSGRVSVFGMLVGVSF